MYFIIDNTRVMKTRIYMKNIKVSAFYYASYTISNNSVFDKFYFL